MNELWAVILDRKFSSFHRSREDAENEAFLLEVVLCEPNKPSHIVDYVQLSA